MVKFELAGKVKVGIGLMGFKKGKMEQIPTPDQFAIFVYIRAHS